jgi:hypothetical protein
MEWTQVAPWILLGVVLACVAGALVLATVRDIAAARRRAQIRAEQYRAEAELQRLTQAALRQMFETARLDARLRTPPTASTSSSGRITPSPSDIEGEAWDGTPR